MPGSVQNATPVTVLPQTLCRAFAHEREYPVIENEYRNGESQRAVLADGSRKSWRLAKRLTAAQLTGLRAFYQARKGAQEPFYFYDPWEAVPKFAYDPTGASRYGRYTVRFHGNWSESVGLRRADVEIALVELA